MEDHMVMDDASMAMAPPPTLEDDDNVQDQADEGMDEAAAAAQVALMDGHFNNRTGRGNQSNRVAEEALIGAANNDNVEAYMDQDESGVLVEQRFLQFLESL